MFCPRCGRQLLDNATFCPECGAPIEASGENADALSAISSLGSSVFSVDGATQMMDPQVALDDFDEADEAGADDVADDEGPLVVNVRPAAYDTEAYQPVYQADMVSYSDPAYGGYADDYTDDGLYVIPETVAPLTYANVKPITGGTPAEHYLNRRRRRRRKFASFIVLLLLLAAAGGVAWYTWDQEMWGGRRVPSVIGMTEQEARSALTVKGLHAEVEEVPADAGIGIVLGSVPAEGDRCATDEPVTLQIAANRVIPDVVGMMVDDARAALTEEGATNIVLTYANSEQEEGTVLSVEPAAGNTFISTDPITIKVAQPYTVPNVVGMTLSEAQQAVSDAGLQSQVEYYNSWATRDTIIAVQPEAGTRVTENAMVTLWAPIPYPATVYELGYYYRITPEQTSAYLNYLNYTLEQGGTYNTGEGYERWKGATGDIISFTNEPESKSGPAGKNDVFADGVKWTAVRYQIAKGSAGSKLEVNEANALAIVKACGLGGNTTDSCNQNTITTPYAINREAYDFVCVQGEWGDYVWVCLLWRAKSVTNTIVTPQTTTGVPTVGEDGTVTETTTTTYTTTTTTTAADSESSAVVAFMPKETTYVSGLASYGNSFCDYFAYANLYSSTR